MEDFINFCKETNRKCIQAQKGEKEVVTEESAVRAIYIIKNMKICSLGDALLYSAALNILNTYVKQDNGDRPYIGYFFKSYADVLARYLVNNAVPGMKLELQKDRGMTLLVVDLFGIQCSFHRVALKEESLKKIGSCTEGKAELRWDGVRKQHCANTFFECAFSNPYLRTDIDLSGESLFTGMEKAVQKYREGVITIKKVG